MHLISLGREGKNVRLDGVFLCAYETTVLLYSCTSGGGSRIPRRRIPSMLYTYWMYRSFRTKKSTNARDYLWSKVLLQMVGYTDRTYDLGPVPQKLLLHWRTRAYYILDLR